MGVQLTMKKRVNSGEISLFVIVGLLIVTVAVSLVGFYVMTGNFKLPKTEQKVEQTSESSDLSLKEIRDMMDNVTKDADLKNYLQGKIDSNEPFVESFKLTWTDRVLNNAITFSGADFDCAEILSQYAKKVFLDGLPNPGLGKTYTIEVMIDLDRGTQNIQVKTY